MASSSSSIPLEPTEEQVLFARAIILTFNLWPALRLAVSEEWGGPESADKKQFLIEHLADTYGGKIGYSKSTFQSLPQPIKAADLPLLPDQDDLADLLENYFQDEFEVRLDDDSADWISRRLVDLWKIVFDHPENDFTQAREAIVKLEKAMQDLRGTKSKVTKGPEQDEIQGHDDEEDEEDNDGDEEMTDGTNQNSQSSGNGNARRQRQEPQVDEDGFTTVVSSRRR